jgi:hypothetical protein
MKLAATTSPSKPLITWDGIEFRTGQQTQDVNTTNTAIATRLEKIVATSFLNRIPRHPAAQFGRQVAVTVEREATAGLDGFGAEAVAVHDNGGAGGLQGLSEGVVSIAGGGLAVNAGKEDAVVVVNVLGSWFLVLGSWFLVLGSWSMDSE